MTKALRRSPLGAFSLREVVSDEDLYKRAIEVTPKGTQTFSRMRGAVGTSEYPIFAESADGAYLQCRDGTRYIDLAGANASAPLGFNDEAVCEAVWEHVGTGGTLSLPTELEVETSEALVAAVPAAEQVRWVRTGSEAVSAAVLTARQATGRHAVLAITGNYHGWHPWTRDDRSIYRVSPWVENLDGVSILMTGAQLESGPFTGDATDMRQVAAVIVEPPRMEPITPAYRAWLQTVRDQCSSFGTLLVYDDVVFAFRFVTGGLQQATDIYPDIACFSKALGNGVPVGCIAGTRAVMSGTPVSSTFGGETVGLAAAQAVLAIHAERDVCAELHEVGTLLRATLEKALDGTPIEVYGTPVHFRFQVKQQVDEEERPDIMDAFLNGCLEKNVLVHRSANNASLAMTKAVRAKIGFAVEAAAHGLDWGGNGE